MPSKFSTGFLKEYKNLLEHVTKGRKIIKNQLDKLDKIYDLMEKSKSVHLYGEGRSGSVAVSLALRLSHFSNAGYLPYKVYFIGDVVKEPINSNDTVILISGSGETAKVVDIAKKAKRDKARVVAITSYEDSTLAKKSDVVFFLPGGLEKKKGWDYLETQISKRAVAYGGGEFEVLAYLFQEAFLTRLGRYKNIPMSVVPKQHERDEVV
jgi:6-phospho-3-hexuloisomerase